MKERGGLSDGDNVPSLRFRPPAEIFSLPGGHEGFTAGMVTCGKRRKMDQFLSALIRSYLWQKTKKASFCQSCNLQRGHQLFNNFSPSLKTYRGKQRGLKPEENSTPSPGAAARL
jgi:hypothetical protein